MCVCLSIFHVWVPTEPRQKAAIPLKMELQEIMRYLDVSTQIQTCIQWKSARTQQIEYLLILSDNLFIHSMWPHESKGTVKAYHKTMPENLSNTLHRGHRPHLNPV